MSATSGALGPAETGRLAYKWKVLISVIFGIFMVILDMTVVNIAFRALQEEFAANVNDSQWIISIYVLAMGISTPLAGFLGDRFGIKRVFLGALTVFVLGSLLCGLAPSLGALVAARALQGVGGGLALPLGTALLFAAFPPKEQGMALGFFGIAIVVAPALGPLLGGWLVDLGLWRWIFFINVPIGVLGVALGARWLRHQAGRASQKLDALGLLFSTVGFGSVLYAASVAAERGWSSPSVTTFFAIGVAALVAFALVELFVAKDPLLDLRLFRNPTFLSASFVGWVSVTALFGAEFLMPLYLQLLRGRSALETGLILLPLAVTAGMTTPVAGRLYDRIGPRPLVVTGFTLLMVNTWQLSQLQADTSIRWILALLALRGLALGLTMQTTLVTALSVVALPKVSRGSALVNSTRQVVQSIAVAALATVLASTLTPGLSERLQGYQSALPATAQASVGQTELCRVPTDGAAVVPAPVRADIGQFCDEYILGLERAYGYTFYAALVATLLGALLPGWPLRWAGRQQAPADPSLVASH